MLFISFIFIPDLMCSIWVALCIISVEAGVLGYMSLWNVNLDSISMINLIMCAGFSVDFTAHICYAYMSCKADTAEERVRESLYSVGLPICQGAISTILGVVALAVAGSYIFLVFFKMIFLVVLFGAAHGLLLLPVLLSIFDFKSCRNSKKKKLKIDKAYPHPHPYTIPHPSLHPVHQYLGNNNQKYLGGLAHNGNGVPKGLVMTTYNGETHGKFILG